MEKMRRHIQIIVSLSSLAFGMICLWSVNPCYSSEKKINFSIRIGQGGFRDNRSPLGKLGGGQLTLDINPTISPLALSISSEYYTNSADPTHSYEIAGLLSANLLYTAQPFHWKRATLFLGGGIGGMDVPIGGSHPGAMERGFLYNAEGGMNLMLFWKIGFYGIGKYLYSVKKKEGIKAIDFNEFIILLGITFNFSLSY